MLTSAQIWAALATRLNGEPLLIRLTAETSAVHPKVDEAHAIAVDTIRLFIQKRIVWPLDEPWPAALRNIEVSLTLERALAGQTSAPAYVKTDAETAMNLLKDISAGKADLGDIDPSTPGGQVHADMYASEPSKVMDTEDLSSPLMRLKGGGLPPR